MEELAFHMLATLADVERRNRTVIAHHPGPYLARLALFVGEIDHREITGNCGAILASIAVNAACRL
jgi:hypothetical protein